MGKSDYTYGIGLEIDAKSFKSVRDELKSGFDTLKKLCKQYEEALKVDPNVDLSKFFAEVREMKSIVDGINRSDNSFAGFVDKGVLNRISALEDGLKSIMSISGDVNSNLKGITDQVEAMIAPLKEAGKAKIPGTYDQIFGGSKDQSKNIQRVQDEINKFDNLTKTLNDHKKNIKKATDYELEDMEIDLGDDNLKSLIDQFQKLSSVMADYKKNNKDNIEHKDFSEYAKTLSEISELATKINFAMGEVDFKKFDNLGWNVSLDNILDNIPKQIEQTVEQVRSKKQALTKELGTLQEEQSLYSAKQASRVSSSKGSSLGVIPGVTAQVEVTPKVNEGEWTSKIQSVLKNVEAKLPPIEIEPTFLRKSKNVKKETEGALEKIDHTVTVDLEVKDNLAAFEEKIDNIDKKIKFHKERIAKSGDFRIKLGYDKEDLATLKTIPVTLEVSNEGEVLSEINRIRDTIEDKLKNIKITLSAENIHIPDSATIKSSEPGIPITPHVVAGESKGDDNTKSKTKSSSEVGKISKEANKANKEVNKLNAKLKDLEKNGFRAKDFLTDATRDKNGKYQPKERNKLKKKVDDFDYYTNASQNTDKYDERTRNEFAQKAKELQKELNKKVGLQKRNLKKKIEKQNKAFEDSLKVQSEQMDKQISAQQEIQHNVVKQQQSAKDRWKVYNDAVEDLKTNGYAKSPYMLHPTESAKEILGISDVKSVGAEVDKLREKEADLNKQLKTMRESKSVDSSAYKEVNEELERTKELLVSVFKAQKEYFNGMKRQTEAEMDTPSDDKLKLSADATKELNRLRSDLKKKEESRDRNKEIVKDLEANGIKSKYFTSSNKALQKYFKDQIGRDITSQEASKYAQTTLQAYESLLAGSKGKKYTLDELKTFNDTKNKSEQILNGALQAQIKHYSGIRDNQTKSVNNIKNQIKDIENGKVDVNTKPAVESINDLTERLSKLQSMLSLLKSDGGYLNVADTEIGNRKNRGNVKNIQGLVDVHKSATSALASVDKDDKRYNAVKKKYNSTGKTLEKIRQDQIAYCEAEISNIERQIAAGKKTVASQNKANKIEQNKTQQKEKGADEAAKQENKAKQQVQISEEKSPDTPKESISSDKLITILSSIDGKVGNIVSQLGSGINIQSSDVKITAGNVQVDGSINTGKSKTKKKDKSTEKSGPKESFQEKRNKKQQQETIVVKRSKGNKKTSSTTTVPATSVVSKKASTPTTDKYMGLNREAFMRIGKGKQYIGGKPLSMPKAKISITGGEIIVSKVKTNDSYNQGNNQHEGQSTNKNKGQTGSQYRKGDRRYNRDPRDVITMQSGTYDHRGKLKSADIQYRTNNNVTTYTDHYRTNKDGIMQYIGETYTNNFNRRTQPLIKSVEQVTSKYKELQRIMNEAPDSISGEMYSKLTAYERLLSKLQSEQQKISSNPNLLADSGYRDEFDSILYQLERVKREFLGLQKSEVDVSKLNSLTSKFTSYEEQIKRSGQYTEEFAAKFAQLRNQLNNARTVGDIELFNFDFNDLKAEIAEMKTYSQLYDKLVKSRSRQIELGREIKYSDSSTNAAEVELKAEQEISKNLERQLSAYTGIYDRQAKMKSWAEARAKAEQSTAKSVAKQADKQADKQNNAVAKIIEQAQTKYDAMRYADPQSAIPPMAGAGLDKIERYSVLLTELKQKQREIANNPKLMADQNYKGTFNSLIAEMNKVEKEINSIQSASANLFSKIKSESDIKILDKSFDSNNMTALHTSMRDFANQVGNGRAELVKFDDVQRSAIFSIQTGKNEVQQLAVAYDRGTNSLGRYVVETRSVESSSQKFVNNIKRGFMHVSQYLASFGGVYEIFAELRRGLTYVLEIDTALTQLKKVTDATDATYAQFISDMSQVGSVVGATTSELINSAADWARLGYSIQEAGELAKNTAVLMNVSEFDNVEDATEAMISTLQAYNVQAENSVEIVDKLNIVGNNFAISSDGIAEGLKRSASTLVEAGNSLEQSIAMMAAGNKVIQDPEQVGSALKVLSMRIRGRYLPIYNENYSLCYAI